MLNNMTKRLNFFSIDDDIDSINSIVLLIDHIESINVSSLEKFIAMFNVNLNEFNTYDEVMRNSHAQK